MSHMISCFEKTMEYVKPLPKNCLSKAKKIYLNDSFTEFLDYCKEHGCFGPEGSDIWTLVRYGVCDYESGDSNYSEENYEKKNMLCDVLFSRDRNYTYFMSPDDFCRS